ncbi:sialate O-acetylesterase [Flavivirga sp. 57AJ16]|uniref:sialate O-acetylesterase n=1 Tax=Flavivirga sp. 57AJ16 TaxID=3025307 RepID=UPI002365FC22|nr:sialate O-acetylesterase [Flavivirga sp. 57AJ16]MDD7887516.1 sialate O-acetylesterase [Flavivirga sp. 57AJ16]
MYCKLKHIGLFLMLLMCHDPLLAKVELPRFFSSHMVLQRNEPIHIYGTAAVDETVSVNFLGMTLTTVADKAGRWAVLFDPQPAGGPYEIQVKGDNTIVLSDVYLGDVWFCSGQSNMAWKIENALHGEDELAKANYENIKLFTVPRIMAGTQETELPSGSWKSCTPNNAKGFSAVAYFFGKNLYETYNIPIGLVNASWGGTNIEAWMDAKFFEHDPVRRELLKSMAGMDMEKAMMDYKKAHKVYSKTQDEQDLGIKEHWESIDTDYSNWEVFRLPSLWRNTDLKKTYGVVWVTKEFILKRRDLEGELILSLGRIDDEDVTYVNGIQVGASTKKDFDRVYKVPSKILKEGVNRITIKIKNLLDLGGFRGADSDLYLKTEIRKLSLVGEWCYKVGTPQISKPPSRVHPRYYPSSLYNSMVHPFFDYKIRGVIWYQGESNTKNPEEYAQFFPKMITDWRSKWGKEVPFLFVQLANYANQGNREPAIREAQAAALDLNKTAMVVTLDIGEDADVHPKNKQEVGRRLALAAYNLAYGDKRAALGGPGVSEVQFNSEEVLVTFNESLIIKGDTNNINGFVVSNDGNTFKKASAKQVSKNVIRLHAKEIKSPQIVRYLWEDAPGEVMVFNKSGLPAPPFKTTKN